jgi:hypothetical protein
MSRPNAKKARPSGATESVYAHPLVPALASLEITFTSTPERPELIRLDRSCKHGNFVVLCIHGKEAAHVALLVVYPIKTVAPAQFETLRLLNHLNDALPGGGFRLDFSDGEITFRHCIHLGDAPLDPESVRCALALVCYAVDHALPQLAAVALGQCTYAEVLARQNTQGGTN